MRLVHGNAVANSGETVESHFDDRERLIQFDCRSTSKKMWGTGSTQFGIENKCFGWGPWVVVLVTVGVLAVMTRKMKR